MNAAKQLAARLSVCTGLVSSLTEDLKSARPLRVGVIFRSLPGWGAGAAFYRMFIRSLDLVAAECGVECGLVVDRSEEAASSAIRGLPGGRWWIQKKSGLVCWEKTARFHQIDVYVDLFCTKPWATGVGTVCWIPDFQHCHQPSLFEPADIAYRNAAFAEQCNQAAHILCSSKVVASDCGELFPESAGKVRVGHFPSNLVFEALPPSPPAATVSSYHLPEKFALVANQFWSHKNHHVVIKAVAEAQKTGIHVPVVLTGLPLDYRDPSNGPTSTILQAIARLGLAGQVIPLGQVPYCDLLQLMRSAALIIQPSRYEGWSTIVQDGKALGRPLFCSDIPVHREQAPGAGFFGCDSPDELAALLVSQWPHLEPGGDAEHEREHLRNHLEVALDYGRLNVSLARSAADSAQSSAGTASTHEAISQLSPQPPAGI